MTLFTGWTPEPDYFQVCAALTRQIDAALGRDVTIEAIRSAGDCTWVDLAAHLTATLNTARRAADSDEVNQ